MRITNNLLNNRFYRHLNDSISVMDNLNERVLTGSKFNRASEDVAGAMKALKVRRSLSRNDQYQKNIRDAQGVLDQTESTLMGIHEILNLAKENGIQGSNGVLSDSNRETMMTVFKGLQDSLLKLANEKYAGKYIFGGPNTTTPPFTFDADGNLMYNGVDVNDAANISTEEIFVDVGLGLSFNASGQVEGHTAVSVSTPGSSVLGYGVDADGIPNNIYLLFGDIINSLESNDMPMLEKQLAKVAEKGDSILVQVAGIGERCQYVEFLNDRMELTTLNLQKKQMDIESADRAKSITDFKQADMAYQAALQMGSKILQTSLLDFLR